MDRIAVVRVQPYKCDYRLSVKIARVQGPGGYMQLWHARKFVRITVFFWSVTILSFAQNATGQSSAYAQTFRSRAHRCARKSGLRVHHAKRPSEEPCPEGRNLQQFRKPLPLLVSELPGDDRGQ